MSLKEFINEKYLDPEVIREKQEELFTSSLDDPVRILIMEDFIKPELYSQYKKIIESTPYISCKRHDKNGRKSQSVFIPNDELYELHNFFESQSFEKYMSLFFKKNVKRSFYIGKEKLRKYMNIEEKGLVAEVYEKGEYLDWHLDKCGSESIGNFIYYLSLQGKEINEENGGYLELGTPITHDNIEGMYSNIKGYKKVFLKENSCVLMFVDEVSFHRIVKIKTDISRITLNSSLIKI